MDSLPSLMWLVVIERQICESSNHRKSMKIEPNRQIA